MPGCTFPLTQVCEEMGGGRCSSSAATASSGRLCRDGKPFPVTLPQHKPCGTRRTPKGFQLLQPWEKQLMEGAGNAPENRAGSGQAEMGCSDTGCCLSANALHSSPSARLTSCCSTAKNNRSPDERKCTRRVRGRQWFWQGCFLGKAGGENGERTWHLVTPVCAVVSSPALLRAISKSPASQH